MEIQGFLKVHANVNNAIAREPEYRPMLVNFHSIKKITNDGDHAKITYTDGTTEKVKESFDKLEAEIFDTLAKAYRAEDPLPPTGH
jgi:hypothetical protein